MENVKHIARTISYPSRESISTRATQHLVDVDDVKWVDSHTHMESLPDVLVTYLVAQMRAVPRRQDGSRKETHSQRHTSGHGQKF
jgi:hypothetical protein